jgi:hypothetical protein
MAALEASQGAQHTAILGIGSYRPSLVVPNDDIVEAIDSSDEWIQQRSGIRTRRFATPEETVQMMSEPMKESEALIKSGRIRHDGSPVMTWMMGNVVAKYDANENVYPRKEREQDKIDGPVAQIMALGAALRHQFPPDLIYEQRPSFLVV